MDTLATGLQLPDLWQSEAIRALQEGRDVVVDAPTGAGKTYIFELLIENGWRGQAVYTVPTRALANDKLLEWRGRNWNVGITTGDIAENVDAPVVVATLETQKFRFLEQTGPSLLVIDEYQMMADRDRGVNYELVMALAPPQTRLLLLSGSVRNPEEVAAWLGRLQRDVALVRHAERPVPQEEVCLEALRERVPASVPLAVKPLARALVAGMGPILIFAPRRRAAEKLARQLNSCLPIDEPLVLTPEQVRLAGPELTKLLRNRITYHHSGLSYAQRAGLIEPLAKRGQLRLVVATLGLSAGINFSLRSVLVTDKEYRAYDRHYHVRPDELLQMMGRAGRRGLDKKGYILWSRETPRLAEAKPLQVRRSSEVDWPSLLAIMQAAVERGDDPVAAADDLAARLFSRKPIALGLQELAHADRRRQLGASSPVRPVAPRRGVTEILNSQDQWERRKAARRVRLGEALVRDGEQWRLALEVPAMLRRAEPGNIVRLRDAGLPVYGREVPLAAITEAKGQGELALTKWLAKAWREYCERHRKRERRGRKQWTHDALEARIIPALPELTGGGRFCGQEIKAGMVFARLAYDDAEVMAQIDSHGQALLNPPQRERDEQRATSFAELFEGRQPGRDPGHRAPTGQTPAEAWYALGLIDDELRPTRRGVIFSFFHHGEGLAIAAALEDEDYPVEDLIYDIANLRAGHRFAEKEEHSGRLGATCQATYGTVNYAGYLHKGLPLNYGDGCAEVLALYRRNPATAEALGYEELRTGDIERAHVEWRSLVNHIAHAPDFPWDRWQELRQNARQLAAAMPAAVSFDELPTLTMAQRTRAHSVLRFR